MLLMDPISEVAHPVEGAANTLLQSGVLGALLIIVGAFAFYAVFKWNKANESRVKDQKEMAKTLVDLTNGLKDALREVNGTTDALKEAVKANTAASEKMERTMNETVRDAIRATGYQRRYSPTGVLSTSSGEIAPVKR
jgi:hypothetical protein